MSAQKLVTNIAAGAVLCPCPVDDDGSTVGNVDVAGNVDGPVDGANKNTDLGVISSDAKGDVNDSGDVTVNSAGASASESQSSPLSDTT